MKQNTPKNSGKFSKGPAGPPSVAATLAQGARPPMPQGLPPRPMGPVPPPGLPPGLAQGGPPPAMNPLMAGRVGPPMAPGGIDPALLAKLFQR